MRTDRPRGSAGLLVGLLTGVLLLGGCSGASPSGDEPDTRATATPTAARSGSSSPSGSPGSTGEPGDPGAGGSGGEESQTGTSPETSPETSPDSGLEMPVAPEPTVSSLGELLAAVDDGPLVTAPLPAAASARGRLVRRFPAVLRPTRSSRVQSSSISPSGDRLQVGLVGSTTLSPEQVLMAYRARFATRGLAEEAAPATASGARAAAFRRGSSSVTITVTRQGPRTSYAVLASLHTGRE